MNNSDPFGLKVVVSGSARFKEQVQHLYDTNADFRADYDELHDDSTATYVLFQDASTDDNRTWGGLMRGFGSDPEVDMTPYAASVARERGIAGNVRGISRIGTRSGLGDLRCTVVHEIIHLKGLANGGLRQNLGHSNDGFARPYFQQNGCKTTH